MGNFEDNEMSSAIHYKRHFCIVSLNWIAEKSDIFSKENKRQKVIQIENMKKSYAGIFDGLYCQLKCFSIQLQFIISILCKEVRKERRN